MTDSHNYQAFSITQRAEMIPQERDAAECRLAEIKHEIKRLLASDAPIEGRIAQWELLLTESLNLQQLLDGENFFGRE